MAAPRSLGLLGMELYIDSNGARKIRFRGPDGKYLTPTNTPSLKDALNPPDPSQVVDTSKFVYRVHQDPNTGLYPARPAAAGPGMVEWIGTVPPTGANIVGSGAGIGQLDTMMDYS